MLRKDASPTKQPMTRDVILNPVSILDNDTAAPKVTEETPVIPLIKSCFIEVVLCMAHFVSQPKFGEVRGSPYFSL